MRLIDRLHNMINASSDHSCRSSGGIYMLRGSTSHASYSHTFCAKNAYSYINKQVSFGPRVTGSTSSIKCSKWLIDTLKQFGVSNIKEQHVQLTAYNGDKLEAINISGQIKPEDPNRVVLFAHWDSRPWADNDSIKSNRSKAIDGANDGASGVGVILELARVFANKTPVCGIDILFLDAEDYGQRTDEVVEEYDEYSWCLGSQFWINHPTLDMSKVHFAILLDMVGGKNAIFPREYISQCAAGYVNDFVWQLASNTEFASRFPDSIGGAVIDDHVYFILHQIPAIAIIETNNPTTGSFNPTWHTVNDTMENIDLFTIEAVGSILEQLFL